jgi:hypothetical protein
MDEGFPYSSPFCKGGQRDFVGAYPVGRPKYDLTAKDAEKETKTKKKKILQPLISRITRINRNGKKIMEKG